MHEGTLCREIIKSTESKAHPLMTSPKKKISSLMSNQARGIMNISIISDSRIVSSVFIIVIFIC